jgi:trypanothione synthetase/amidase
VQIFKTKDEIVEENNGEFANRDCIYQEAFELPSFEGFYPVIGSWIVNRRFGFAGFGIREDKTLITGVDSPFACCRIISN